MNDVGCSGSQTCGRCLLSHQITEERWNKRNPEHAVVAQWELWRIIVHVEPLIGRARFEMV